MTTIVLMGIKGCGKSSVGRKLAEELHIPFYDSDAEIVKRFGKRPRELYRKKGVSWFMCAEQKVIKKLKDSETPFIFSSGGGLCDNEEALKLLPNDATKIFLDVTEERLFERLRRCYRKGFGFPAYLSQDEETAQQEFSVLYAQRRNRYQQISDIHITITASENIDDIANKIITHLN